MLTTDPPTFLQLREENTRLNEFLKIAIFFSFFLLCFALRVKLFWAYPKMAYVFECEKIYKKSFLYIVSNIGFKDKAYEFNLLVVP
jgi:hypothetical protein